MLALLAALALASDTPVAAPSPTSAFTGVYPAPLVTAARAYRGRKYKWAGRADTLDCMGLVFRAWTDVTGQRWEALSENPTELVAARSFGAPVPGLDGVLTEQIDWSLLRSGDVIFFLSRIPNPVEPSLVTLDGQPHWVRHMALYEGDLLRRFIAGEHTRGQVAELPLPGYLDVWRVMYQGIFVVRPGT